MDRAVAHPHPRQYWLVFLLLAVITAVEVAVVYIDALRSVLAALLVVLAGAKFALVARWYMHLKFDKPLYSRFFLVGIVGSLGMFAVVLATFGVVLAS